MAETPADDDIDLYSDLAEVTKSLEVQKVSRGTIWRSNAVSAFQPTAASVTLLLLLLNSSTYYHPHASLTPCS